MAGPHYEQWRHSAVEVARMRDAVARTIVWNLRDDAVKAAILCGEPFWVTLACNVVCAEFHWPRSGRVRVNALRALRWHYEDERSGGTEKQELGNIIERALLVGVELGLGEEFRAYCGVARALATMPLIAELERRATLASDRSVRINASRMLDFVNGQPYRRYRDVAWTAN